MASTSGGSRPSPEADIRASVRDASRFHAVFERHVEGVHRYVARRLGASLAEDVVGETFVVAFRRRGSYDPTRASERAWLLGIATNLVRRHYRSEMRRLAAYRRVDPTNSVEPADLVVDQLADAAVLDLALAQISAELREVILLVGGCELTYAEASAALDIPLGTVRSRMSRARSELRAALARIASQDEDRSRCVYPRGAE